jgi:hypothetical protein
MNFQVASSAAEEKTSSSFSFTPPSNSQNFSFSNSSTASEEKTSSTTSSWPLPKSPQKKFNFGIPLSSPSMQPTIPLPSPHLNGMYGSALHHYNHFNPSTPPSHPSWATSSIPTQSFMSNNIHHQESSSAPTDFMSMHQGSSNNNFGSTASNGLQFGASSSQLPGWNANSCLFDPNVLQDNTATTSTTTTTSRTAGVWV